MKRGAAARAASGKSGMAKRRKPYVPSFSRIAARITEPAVGASTWASGSQVWTGHIGSFTAKEAKNAHHAQVCKDRGTDACNNVGRSVVLPFQYSAMMASSMNTEPRNV